MTSPTYIIKRSQVEAVLSMADCVPIVEDAFRLCGEGGVQMPPKAYLYFDKGDLRCMPAYIPAQNIAGVKNVNVHPANTDMPTVMATITLFDPETGFPLAIMDGTYITRMRTGAAGGVAAKYLAREDSATAAFIGAGAQARTQLEALLITRPNISRIIVFDAKPAAMDAFAQDVKDTCGLKVQCAASVAEALREADIVTTTTPARGPIVRSDYVRPGTHINAIGADARGKQELDPEILKRATLVIDNWLQASHGGEINVAVSEGIITREDIHADIGEIVTGKKPGRQSDEEVTVFDS
ncbi:MAG: ornithine cyclodeaminase family protein, partial [Planctomycetia bacterium]|nr:ornithine cyclodeaminase family protein [Planctomycetia bacterium]